MRAERRKLDQRVASRSRHASVARNFDCRPHETAAATEGRCDPFGYPAGWEADRNEPNTGGAGLAQARAEASQKRALCGSERSGVREERVDLNERPILTDLYTRQVSASRRTLRWTSWSSRIRLHAPQGSPPAMPSSHYWVGLPTPVCSIWGPILPSVGAIHSPGRLIECLGTNFQQDMRSQAAIHRPNEPSGIYSSKTETP